MRKKNSREYDENLGVCAGMDLEADRLIAEARRNVSHVTCLFWLTWQCVAVSHWLLEPPMLMWLFLIGLEIFFSLTWHALIGWNTLSAIRHNAMRISRQTIRHPITASDVAFLADVATRGGLSLVAATSDADVAISDWSRDIFSLTWHAFIGWNTLFVIRHRAMRISRKLSGIRFLQVNTLF
ncbi:hypothetical protein Syun_003696 [Stephania yunnanensis]|uniref:Uncharacterized protein n=1 Tax=Stephania yunnanensis TaxID=152371 RepID=A0AAP0L5K8_9MAGN